MKLPHRSSRARRWIADHAGKLARWIAPEMLLVDLTTYPGPTALVSDSVAALKAAEAERLVEAIKGRALLPGEDLDVEIRTATSILRRLGFGSIVADAAGHASIPISTTLAIEIGGFLAPPSAGGWAER